MHIRKARIRNFKSLKQLDIEFNEHLNIIVGDNETGKTTLLEAVHLALTGHLDGRPALFDIHPYLFNVETVQTYITSLRTGETAEPPKIAIELYLSVDPVLARLQGTNNTLKEDTPGVTYTIQLDDANMVEYAEYVRTPENVRTVPVEFYTVVWRSFANETLTAKNIPLKTTTVDATNIKSGAGAQRYVIGQIDSAISAQDRVRLSLSYRKARDGFLADPAVTAINTELHRQSQALTEKALSISLDTTARASWESGVVPHLDDIPLALVGDGEQNTIKVLLAIDAASNKDVILIEEPENHQSHTNLNRLLRKLENATGRKQILITTHSSFVLNRLGIENVLLLARDGAMKLSQLTRSTYEYFQKLPGYNTLRLILARKVILVEGPSDDLIVQKAYMTLNDRKLPIHDGIDVISVGSLAFKRFLEIALILKVNATVITDNDGSVETLRTKYGEYAEIETIRVCYDEDESSNTLENVLLRDNGRDVVNGILGKSYSTDNELLQYMKHNKTDCALAIFSTEQDLKYPEYITNAFV